MVTAWYDTDTSMLYTSYTTRMFLKTYPGVEQIATNYHIASYLGITQQSLSRIRAEKKY